MPRLLLIVLVFAASDPMRLAGMQRIDATFNTRVARPAHVKNHPRVLFDEAHNNTDTATGRYAPFCNLITSDGYRVVPNGRRFSRRTLATYAVLVIVNASGPGGNRRLSPFTDAECDAVRDWVNSGGALLLICDQSPFTDAASPLARRFGVELTKGFTVDPVHNDQGSGDETELVFDRGNGLLRDHPITRGRDATERISRIITYTGASIKGPAGNTPFLLLGDTAKDIFPSERTPGSAPEDPAPDPTQTSAAGRAQGTAFVSGRGRVVVLAEAAMLTAQVAPRGFPFGMNVSGTDNRQLALNVMRWLSGVLN